MSRTFNRMISHVTSKIDSVVLKCFDLIFKFKRVFVRFGETPAPKANLDFFNATDYLDYVVINKIPPNESQTYSDYMIGLWLLHPKAQKNQLDNNLAILFLTDDVPFSGKLKKMICRVISMTLSTVFFIDRIRPACLAMSPSIMNERVSALFRIIHVYPFNIAKATPMKPIKYKQFDAQLCAMFHSGTVVTETNAICASTENTKFGNGIGAAGDPFVVKVNGAEGVTPIYQVGLDVIHSKQKPGLFLNLFPYMQWIIDTIAKRKSHMVASE